VDIFNKSSSNIGGSKLSIRLTDNGELLHETLTSLGAIKVLPELPALNDLKTIRFVSAINQCLPYCIDDIASEEFPFNWVTHSKLLHSACNRPKNFYRTSITHTSLHRVSFEVFSCITDNLEEIESLEFEASSLALYFLSVSNWPIVFRDITNCVSQLVDPANLQAPSDIKEFACSFNCGPLVNVQYCNISKKNLACFLTGTCILI
jgi:hypothetical protein